MSRIGKLPIELPSGVECTIQGSHVKVKGPKGELVRDLHPEMLIEKEESQVVVKRPSDNRTHRALHGLTRALLNNMVVGVSQGYEKQLNIVGVGYKVELRGKALVLNLGYSHPIEYPSPEGIEFEVDSKANTIKVKGIDKEKVGQTSAEIRKMRPPEPYKGKGVMYSDERIRRKAGKAASGK
ncbi:50S ribosomal protein L6 [Nitrospina gracilis]|uniref:50S ribosomal protein L6 n=1 Tax=Nitrospina gracilis TaxID=35801 RepID=UPI001F01A77B|nr:50S ribosomal protein L6 [Nitrospina gracilis]MCF8721726.1 large subunit ribosomal protein L6 [Nitrospina gracilis Nb-211]